MICNRNLPLGRLHVFASAIERSGGLSGVVNVPFRACGAPVPPPSPPPPLEQGMRLARVVATATVGICLPYTGWRVLNAGDDVVRRSLQRVGLLLRCHRVADRLSHIPWARLYIASLLTLSRHTPPAENLCSSTLMGCFVPLRPPSKQSPSDLSMRQPAAYALC